jgi:cytochrome c-type biogenesis protein CcmH
MTPFWTVSLFWMATVVCVAVALAFVLPPLLRKKDKELMADRRDINIAVYRDQMKEMEADRANGLLAEDQFQAAKLELEARLAEDALTREGQKAAPLSSSGRKLGFSLAAIIPVAAFGLYFLLGNPSSLIAIAQAQSQEASGVAQGGHDIMKMILQVEAKTKEDPNDGAAWTLLAKTYAVVGHWPEALAAWEKAIKLRPDVPSVMTGYAEALAINNNRVLEGKPIELVLKALEKDPLDMKGLELAGIYNFQKRNFAKAAFYFKHLYKQLPPDSPYAQDVNEAYKEAKRQSEIGLTGLDNLAAQPDGGAKQGTPDASIRGKVDISAKLKDRLSEKDVVFLFARAGEGGPPVAAIRSPATKFPLEFELNDTMAMNPDNKLSNYKSVTLTARVVKSGDIKGAAGDLEGTVKLVKVGAKDVTVVIDTVRQ